MAKKGIFPVADCRVDANLIDAELISDAHWMRRAFALAQRAEEQGEVPVGAVVIRHNEVIGEGWNQPISMKDPSAHAEIVALRAAGASTQNYRIVESILYVTLEPCVMCIGAIMHARVGRLVYGARDPKSGAADSVFKLSGDKRFNHIISVTGGVLQQVCSELLTDFFKRKRNQK